MIACGSIFVLTAARGSWRWISSGLQVFCTTRLPRAPHELSLVKRRGQRFESARRLSLFGLDKPRTRNVKKPPPLVQRLLDTT